MTNPVLPQNLKTKPLSEQVVDEIRRMVAAGELKAGDMLPTENELTQRLGVSKSSVREAVKMMQAIGIVEIQRGKGTVLSQSMEKGYMNVMLCQMQMQNGSPRELKEFRQMVELACVSVALEKATQEDLEEIGRCVDRFQDQIRQGKPDAEEDLRFHRAIWAATHNRFISTLGEAVMGMYMDSIGQSIGEHPDQALADHQRIYQALQERSGQKVREAVLRSLDVWGDTLEEERKR